MIWIKFLHPNDVYAVDPLYDLSSDDMAISKVCTKCGSTLYLPMEDNMKISQNRGEIFRLPCSHLVDRELPDYPFLTLESGEELQIEAWSLQPITQCMVCNPTKDKESLCNA